MDHHGHLADHAWELQSLANLAGYLCATLHVPSPSLWMEILMEKHHNTNLHDSGGNIATASWYNLYNLPYLSDGQPSIVEFQSWDQVPQLDQISELSVVHTPQEEFVTL
jgi:hypothetical protein